MSQPELVADAPKIWRNQGFGWIGLGGDFIASG